MKTKSVILLAALALLLPSPADAATELRRYLLAVGANAGGPDRVALKYAVTDAERFAATMVAMGGVEPGNSIVLSEPDEERLRSALAALAERVSARSAADRTEVIVYYSGHADENGLRLGPGRLPYRDLRAQIEVIPAAVRITVLDACASGTITRVKGGERRPPFLVDESSAMEGYAILTSSTGDENAQESDAIGSSFFTHYLVSGLRGAADASGDGRVSLTEAYQFAFNETLARTTETLGGAQHPSYQVNLAGTGDVVMTDVRRTSAGLVLGEDLDGRFYVRDRDEHLVAELFKPRGRRVVLGLEAGDFRIHLAQAEQLFVARVELGLDELLVLKPEHFETAERTPAVARGGEGAWPPRPGFLGPLAGRSRLQLLMGRSATGIGNDHFDQGLVSVRAETQDFFLGLGYWRWLREDLSVGAWVRAMDGDAAVDVGAGATTRATGLASILIGVRRYLPAALLRTPVRPFVAAGAGVWVGSEETVGQDLGGVVTESRTMGAFGVDPGLGADILIGRNFMLGAEASYSLLTDFPQPLGGRRNYSGLELTVSVSWIFGRGFGD